MGTHARFRAALPGAPNAVRGLHAEDPRPLRLLVHGLNFWPDLTGVAKYTFEMAEWFARRGHDVAVVTAPPYYPSWKVGEGYSARRYLSERVSGIEVCRCPLYVPGDQTAARRVVHALSFGASSWAPTLYRAARWRPDLVWTVAPSMIAAGTALAAARLARVPAWLHIQDLEADAAFALGFAGGRRLQRSALALESRFMRQFDRISTISEAMRAKVLEKGCRPAHVSLVPNWVDVEDIRPLSRPNRFRAELGIPENGVVALYSGNMGRKQGLQIVVQAAEKLTENSDLHFVMAGAGPERPALEAAARHLRNVRFLPLQPVEHLPELLNMADVHLLPQVAHAADLVLPSKLSGMMASARPVVATAEDGTELAREVAPVGIVTPPGDVDRFAAAVAELAASPELRHRLGEAGRQRAADKWDRQMVLGCLEAAFCELAETSGKRRLAPRAAPGEAGSPPQRLA